MVRSITNSNLLTVSLVCLLDAPVVGDIFPLSIDTVERLVNKRMSVVAVLPYDTIGSLQEVILGLLLPPVGQVSWSTSAQIKLKNPRIFYHFCQTAGRGRPTRG